MEMMTKNSSSIASIENYNFSDILPFWDISFKQSHQGISISGSPERCSYRIVVEDDSQQKYILEKIIKKQYYHKKFTAQILCFLSNQKIREINPYLQNNHNEFITKIKTDFWQLQPFITGCKLNRPDYVFDEWRGNLLADFLICLWKKSKSISEDITLPVFSLKDYVINMIKNMQRHNPMEYEKIKPIYDYLSFDFFQHYSIIPTRFCHGDYHPLNILWGEDSIKAVIDWEFLGEKIEIYDMANLLGCLGIEEPTSLVNDMALAFIKRIKDSKIISEIGFDYLFDSMIALRFAWLAEWLRHFDKDMIQLEIDFLNLLNKNKILIKEKWDSL